ncbi:hypothetical protein SAMN05443292_1941 [Halpernia frigidisoli]|uniref:Uncharacterized protein n=1 Tax=Halpernia frigidisoli TaxID=1125876 RepID=A0A1I3GNI2_9FLAO|nr:hypothetical protein SAMN05443292_1941 [Halpernia frigidisoli]
MLATVSCASIKYNLSQDKGNFSEIKAGEKYSVFDLKDNKSIINVTSIQNDSIIGTNKDQRVSIAKKDIKDIVKNQTGATVKLATVGAAVIYGAYVILKGVKDTAESIGRALPPL